MANFSNSSKDSSKEKNRVGRNVVSRNLWRIVDKFKVLPTSKDFQELTTEQVDWIVINMNIDAKEEARARSGKDPNEIFEDHDTDWLEGRQEDFEPVKEEHDEKEIAKQLDAMRSNSYLESLEEKLGNMQDTVNYLAENSDEKTLDEYVKEKEIQMRLEQVYEEARAREEGTFKEDKEVVEGVDDMEFEELTNELAQDAINLFEGVEEEDTNKDDQIWF